MNCSNFEEELLELRLDIAVADTFGMDKVRCVTWIESVPTIDELPVEPAPDTCCYVENEESAYLFDGCGWVMFMSPEISAKILVEDTALLESICIQGTLRNGGAPYYGPPLPNHRILSSRN